MVGYNTGEHATEVLGEMLTQDAYATSVDGFRDSPLRRATCLLVPGAAVRIAARLLRGGLDGALIDGADPATSPLLAARTTQLGHASTRSWIADGLERLVMSADAPRSRIRIIPSRAAMLANRSELLEIVGMLRSDRPLYARGIAMLRVILTDGAGPAYTDHRGDTLAECLRAARARLIS